MGEIIFPYFTPYQKNIFINNIVKRMSHKKSEIEVNLVNELAGSFWKIADKSLVGIYLIQDGIFKYVNPRLAEIFGYEPDELINKKGPLDLTSPKDHKRVKENIVQRLSQKVESINYEFTGIKKDSTTIEIEVYGSYITSMGKPAVLGTLLEITEKEELRKSEKKYKELAALLPQTIFEIDQNLNVTFVNQNGFAMFGYSEEDIKGGLDALQMLIPQDRKRASENIIKILSGEKLGGNEYTALKKDGTTFPVIIGATPILSKERIIGLRGFVIDNTEIKKSQEELRKLSQAVKQNPASIVITDTKGAIEYVNPKFTQLTGYSFEEVIGENPRILKSGELPQSVYKDMWNAITSGSDWFGEFHNKKKNGELYWENVSISPIKNEVGEITHFLAVKEDITDKKAAEAELKEAKGKAEEMSRLKSIFLANMSHELRTPMIGILGYAESLYNELREPEMKNMAGILLKSGNRLLDTLNSILDLSRIEANKIDFKFSDLNVSQIIKDSVSLFVTAANEKNLKIKLDIADENIYSMLDKRMFNQVIEHLINNAIKYTNEGEIKIELNKVQIGNDCFSQIKVSDSGIGIPKERQDIIFEPFRQASEGYSRKFEGMGLGLTITKKFIELMNGTISFKSQVGKGSVFTVRFPLVRKIHHGHDQLKKVDSAKKKMDPAAILLVENDRPSADIIKLFLHNIHKVDIALSGKSALEMVKEKKYNLILMDIDLGMGMNGLETASLIKQIRGYKNIPVVAVTAYAMLGDREKFIEAGCTEYIAKPFNRNALIELINKVLQN